MINDKNEIVNFRVEYNKINWDGKTNEIDVICNENKTRQDAFRDMWWLLNFHTIGKNCNYFVNDIEVNGCLEIWDCEESRQLFN